MRPHRVQRRRTARPALADVGGKTVAAGVLVCRALYQFQFEISPFWTRSPLTLNPSPLRGEGSTCDSEWCNRKLQMVLEGASLPLGKGVSFGVRFSPPGWEARLYG